jgi:MoaA/NifB/PqqE/SkfB family radical SAM enzyme
MDFEGFPFIVGWELTLACNLRCEHCGSSAGLPRRDELTLAEALTICEQLPDLLVCEVDFTGGEPLVRPDWWKIAQKLYELKIKPS